MMVGSQCLITGETNEGTTNEGTVHSFDKLLGI